jgi:hypothetical protein
MYIPLVDEIATMLSGIIGCPLDQGKVMTWLFLHIGFGFLYRKIDGYYPRLIYGKVLGTLFCLSMYSLSRNKTNSRGDSHALHFLISDLLRYYALQGESSYICVHRRVYFPLSLSYQENVGE